MLGHISDDEYRTYAGEAGRRLAEMAGDEVGAADLVEQEPRRSEEKRRPQTTLPPKRASLPLRALPAAKRQRSVSPDALQVLLAAIKTDPELRRALLQALQDGAA
jgi:hypothetical protein